MKISVHQDSFSAGEISPLAQGRYKSEGYKSGCKELLNMIPDSRGPAVSREGAKFVREITGNDGRIFNHAVNNASFYTIILTNLKMIITTVEGSTAIADIVTPWAESELGEIYAVQVPSGNATYYLHPSYSPRKLTYDIATDTFVFSTPTFVSPPAVWTGSNWPSSGAHFQGRLWLGATPNQPQSLWSSKSGIPEDFSPGQGVDDDSIAITMVNYGRIEWIASTKNLLVGTGTGEYIVTSEGGVLTPTDHQIDQQSAYGSSSIQAQHVGDQVFYVSPDRVKLRAMQYEWSADNWLSTDLTYFSEHITAPKIKSVSWLQNPYNIFMALMDDGTFAVLSYDRSNNIYGWATHDVGGVCLDAMVGSIDGISVLGMLVQRKNGSMFYETYAPHDEKHYMDSWVDLTFDPPQSVIPGLDHLEGKTVQVLSDGAGHKDLVVSGGSITLDNAASRVHVGIGFSARIKLLPIEVGSKIGSSAAHMKNYHSFDVHLLDSAHPLVNGDRAAVRTPNTPMGEPEPFVTGKSLISLLGWKNETDITIEQDLPLPLTVTGVSGKMEQEIL